MRKCERGVGSYSFVHQRKEPSEFILIEHRYTQSLMVIYKTELPSVYDSYIVSETIVRSDLCPKVSVIYLIFSMYQIDLKFSFLFDSFVIINSTTIPLRRGHFFNHKLLQS